MTEELKSCPFCGGNAHLEIPLMVEPSISCDACKIVLRADRMISVIFANIETGRRKQVEDLVKRWNRRSSPAPEPSAHTPSPNSQMRGWRPIATAPKDETEILVADARVQGGFMNVVSYGLVDGSDYLWHTNDGISYHADAFTDWQPLPTPPSIATKEASDV